jgi:hypothetical protein
MNSTLSFHVRLIALTLGPMIWTAALASEFRPESGSVNLSNGKAISN